MLLFSTTALLKYKVKGANRIIGDISGFLFDKTTWGIKFMTAKSDDCPYAELVISLDRLGTPDNFHKDLLTDLSAEEIDQLPTAIKIPFPTGKASEQPNSYWRIGKFSRFLNWLNQLRILKTYIKRQGIPQIEHFISPKLCSTNEVRGCRVMEQDSKVGEIEDIIIDTDVWKIRFLITSTLDNDVVLPPGRIKKIVPARRIIKLKTNNVLAQGNPFPLG
jgi:hypothetical protein